MRGRIILFLLLFGALLSACGGQQLTAEEIVQRMEAARAATNDAHATVAFTFSGDQRNGNMLVEGWVKKTGQTDETGQPINKLRGVVLESDQAEQVGSLVVSDGNTFWLYNPSRNSVITGTRGDMPQGADPLSAMGAPAELQELISRGMDAFNVEVQGTEQVAGVNTWKLKLTPKTDTEQQLQLDGIVNATMWVDEARALPLKLDVDASSMGHNTVEVRSIETNTGLADDLFTFTPPAGATVTQASEIAEQMRPQTVTLDEARSRVSFPVLAPDYIPSGAALSEVQLVGDSTVIQTYSGSTSFSVVQSSREVGRDRQPPAGSQEQQVTVRGQQGTLITGSGSEQGSLLRWQENGIRFVVAGTLSADDVQHVAESLK